VLGHGSQRFKSGRPLTALARQALTGTDFLPPRPAEAKQAVAARGDLFFCLKGMHILPGQVARVKRVCLPLCQRVSAANLCFYFINMMDHLPAETTNFFGDDPKIRIARYEKEPI
jgi:hypothetical protein